ATRLSLRGDTLRFRTTAFASLSASFRSLFGLPIVLSVTPRSRVPRRQRPVGRLPGAGRGRAGYLPFDAFLSPLWEWNVRVGENSPNLWPIMSSVTLTGTCFWPL